MRRANRTVLAMLVVAAMIAPIGRATGPAPANLMGGDNVDLRWLDRLDSVDRACLNELIGDAPPPFADDLLWIADDPPRWKDLRGKVVVIQTWTSKTPAGRNWAMRVGRLVDEADRDHVAIIALHTPQGADTAPRYLDRRPLDVSVAIDPSGTFCDSLGAYKRPVNVIIDRNGTVRYVGLNQRGVRLAVADLIAEPLVENATPLPKPADEPTASAEFPFFTTKIMFATDLRGRRGPDMYVSQWLNGAPNAQGKVVVVDFWATWCGPCIASIPHTNDLAEKFRDDVVIVGITNRQHLAAEDTLVADTLGHLDRDGHQARLATDRDPSLPDRDEAGELRHDLERLTQADDFLPQWCRKVPVLGSGQILIQ